jgi:hypothetical protein
VTALHNIQANFTLYSEFNVQETVASRTHRGLRGQAHVGVRGDHQGFILGDTATIGCFGVQSNQRGG